MEFNFRDYLEDIVKSYVWIKCFSNGKIYVPNHVGFLVNASTSKSIFNMFLKLIQQAWSISIYIHLFSMFILPCSHIWSSNTNVYFGNCNKLAAFKIAYQDSWLDELWCRICCWRLVQKSNIFSHECTLLHNPQNLCLILFCGIVIFFLCKKKTKSNKVMSCKAEIIVIQWNLRNIVLWVKIIDQTIMWELLGFGADWHFNTEEHIKGHESLFPSVLLTLLCCKSCGKTES